MRDYIYKLFGIKSHDKDSVAERDDFSEFFYSAKSKEKAKLIREVMAEATEKQKAVIKQYKEKQLA